MSKKLRILEVNKAYFPHIGGIETLIRQYSEELGKLDGVSVKALVCRDGKGKAIREKMNGVELLRTGSLGTYFSCPLSFSFIRHFRKMAAKADVVHIHVPFPLADAALLLSGYKGKVVVSWHSDIVKQKKLMFFYKPFMRYLLKRADIILTATEGHVKHSLYLNEYSHKCRVLPYGITPEDYLSVPRRSILTEKATDKSCVKVFFTGRLVYYKGVDVLLKAFTKVKGCELFIAGTGELGDQLRNFVSSHDMEPKVHFLGFLPDEELRQAYADCDIFVLPSVAPSEAFGIVQLEAMVYGKPVINTALKSGVPYVSIDGQTGITVPPSSPKALAAAINRLAEDKELREKYGKAAAERVKSDFNEKVILGKLYDILK
ncbi:glycosyltransferase [Ruminococcus sp.]|jgi:rhamnosyl/mannosyltransferase|uniref:glycosyltransferase n=1 Tax=Ruminococcus sp. TaxID=41978 RepID=UPI0025CE35A8|nr:glycosyltransferase [Ruminococcus sp.]